MTKRLVLALVFLGGLAHAQSSPPSSYHATFQNDIVAVYDLDLAANASVAPLEAAHDSFWISLTPGRLTFTRQQDKKELHFQPADVRFFPSFETKLLTNTGASEFRGVLVALKRRALITNGCECSGITAKTICGCPGSGHLEPLWALSLGEVTLAGTTLASAEGFRSAAPRDDMLLVAITDLELRDEASSSENAEMPTLDLKSGQAIWIKAGRHQWKNIGSETAKFVTFEF